MGIEGKDVVACVAIGASALMVYLGHNGTFMNLIAIIIGWYFGSKKNEQSIKTDNDSAG